MATSPAKAIEPVAPAWMPDSLPPFPSVALKALHLIAGKDTSLPELCNLIRSDPAFSTAILKIANSPLVAFSRNITIVLQASMLRGFQRLKGVVITVGLKSYLTEPFGPLLRSGWRHSVACAMVAERTAGWGGFDKDFAYTAGIMHDIGRIAMAIAMPEPYARVLRAGADDPSDLLKTECAVCGINHCQVGHSLVKAWNLPEGFLDVIASHHSPAALLQGTTSVLRPSCRIANSLGFGVVEYRCPVEYSDLVVEFPERVRNRFPADAKDLASEIAAEINVIESV